jgi:hypothetical protein
MTRRDAWVIAAYAFLAIVVIPVYPHFNSPNEFTRWATAAALIEDHTFEVTNAMPLLGEGFEDLSVVNGHFYSNKAPGGAIVGLPGYAIARMFVGPPRGSNMRTTLTAMRLLASTVPVVLLAVVFVIASRRSGLKPAATVALIALLFGTPLFAYGMLNFSHALTAAALFGAWVLLYGVRPAICPGLLRSVEQQLNEGSTDRRRPGQIAGLTPYGDVAAGALIGLAVTSEYPAAIAGAVLVAFAIGHRSVLRIVAGGAPFAIALALYNRAIFGSFFALSSGFERDPAFHTLAKRGLFGIGIPDPIVMLRLLFDPGKGLLIFSPFLVIALASIPAAKAALPPRQFWTLVLTPLAIFLTYAGYPNWHGGWTVGVRYLVPAMPFLAYLVNFTTDSMKRLLVALLGWSIAAVALTSLVFPFIPPNVMVPWGTIALPLMGHGLIAPNLFHLIARPLAIAIPFAVLLAVMLSLEQRVYALAGAAIVIAIGLLAPVPPIVAVERGFIEEVSFDRTGAIVGSRPEGMMVNPALAERARAVKRMPPTSWPF